MAPKVILLSLDGATDSIVDRYLANGVLDSTTGLGLLKAKGVAATNNETITPSITAPSHIAIATGSTAVNNDINANSFHLVVNPFASNANGFGAPIGGYTYQTGIDPAESTSPTATPIWQTLQAAGKSVVSATFPGADGVNVKSSTGIILDKAADRTVSYTVPFGAFGGVGGTGFSLAAADFSVSNTQAVTGLTALGRTSYSAVKVANLETINGTSLTGGSTKTNYVMQVAAIDTTNDSVTNYDTLVVFDANVGIQAAAALPATGSAFIKAADQKSSKFFFDGSNNKVGTAFYASTVAADLSAVNIARYSGAYIPRPAESPGVIANVDDINNNIGNWAPQADFRFPERINSGLTKFTDLELEAIYADQVKTFVDYQTKVLLRSIQQNPNADLVLGYIEQPDGSGHQFLLTDPRQASDFTNPNSIGAGQDAAKVARYAKYLEVAYQSANAAVQKVIEAVGVDASGKPNSDIIVTSDHGFAPFHTAVNINNLLTNAGFVNTKVRAVVSGPAVNIYINLKGREAAVAGVTQVEPSEYLALQKQVIDLLKGFADTNSNYTNGAASVGVFDKVYNRDIPTTLVAISANDIINARGAFIGQDTGDVFALLKTGYNFDGTQTPAPVIRKGDAAATAATAVLSVPNFYGAHGYDPTLPDMKAIFYAAGPDIVQQTLGSVRNIDIAPTIEKILNVIPAATVDGKAINITTPFPNGVASGDTTQTSTVLWTRSQTPGTVTFEYSTKADFSSIAGTKTATVSNPLQPVKVDVTGLTANTDYFYRAVDATGAKATGQFSTAAALGQLTGLKFGVTGDWRGEIAPYPAISNADDAKLKFFVELGDTIYGDVASPAVKNPNGTEKSQSTTLAEYRAKQAEVYDTRYGLNTFADLRASTSILSTIDDHEVTNDFAGGQDLAKSTAAAQALYGASTGLINDSPLYDNGLQAFQEYNPIRDLTYNTPTDARTNGERKLYRYNTFGSDAANFVLDARSFRDTELTDVTNLGDQTQVGTFLSQSFDPSRTMLGKQQLEDLKRDLLQSQKDGITWKFIEVPEPIQNIGVLAAADRFEGYAAERTEILKFINDNKISNVVFVAADIHGTLVNNLTYQTAPGQAQIATSAFEITTGSVAYSAPFGPTVAQLGALLGVITPAQKATYDALSAAGKNAFIKNIVDGGLAPLGYDPLGLDKNLAQANGLINAKLLQGDYVATESYGWTEFNIDKNTQKLTVTTYGIDPYSRTELEANPAAITSRVPKIVSQFEVTPNSFTPAPLTAPVRNDFNGDKKAEILWRNDDGRVATWQMDGATVTGTTPAISPSLDKAWKVAGTGDFNGDGKTDILWRNSSTDPITGLATGSGNIAIWTTNGTAVTSTATSIPTLDKSWKTVGTADFSGDGKADILWRNDVDGRVVLWTMDGSSVVSSTATSTPTLAASWKAAGTGDFNGDGKADVLWRNDDGNIALWQMNGTAVTSIATSTASLNSSWKAAGTGDFNGDGKTDVLWRNTTTNAAVVWQMDGATVVSSTATSTAGLDSTWQVADIADFNGDAKADILWSKNTGATTPIATSVWTMNGSSVLSATATSTQPLAGWNVATSII
jgi:phosphodiesterase/alkaline phosphatase D-like protein/predicted AlkP superfamily pyrophosphatase or phosphodiesterase